MFLFKCYGPDDFVSIIWQKGCDMEIFISYHISIHGHLVIMLIWLYGLIRGMIWKLLY